MSYLGVIVGCTSAGEDGTANRCMRSHVDRSSTDAERSTGQRAELTEPGKFHLLDGERLKILVYVRHLLGFRSARGSKV